MDLWTQHWSPQPREFKWLQSMWRCVVLSLVENKATLCQWNHCFRPQQNKQNIWQRIQFPCEQALQKLQLQETLITTHKPDFWIANKKSKFHAFSFQNTQTTRKKCAMCTTPGGATFVPWAGFHQQAWELCFLGFFCLQIKETQQWWTRFCCHHNPMAIFLNLMTVTAKWTSTVLCINA